METRLYQPVAKNSDATPLAWLYPAPRSIALSSLGYMGLFKLLDQLPQVNPVCWDSDNLKTANAKDVELIGISFSFELDILEILRQFEALGLPLFQVDRNSLDYPLIFAGGPVPTTNPEPYADFFDFFVLGDGEPILEKLIDTYQELKKTETSKQALLLKLAKKVPGVYVPSLYQVSYENLTGPINTILPKFDDVPFPVIRQQVDFTKSSVMATPVLSEAAYFKNKYLVEVMRGCSHRCRFCLASYSTLPATGPNVGELMKSVEVGLKHTSSIGLLGALIADHPDFDTLCDFIQQQNNIEVSAASLRADTLTEHVAKTFAHGQQRTLTIAVESGSEKVRKRINKHLSTQSIYTAAENVYQAGIPNLKLYFMVGLPEEEPEDIQDSIDLVAGIKKQFPKLKLEAGCSTFVPKAQTPFQWMPRHTTGELKKRHEQFRKGIFKYASFRPTSPKWDTVQAIFSRGDRRLAPFIVALVKEGGNLGAINRAFKPFKAQLPDLDKIATESLSFETVLPWEHLSLGQAKPSLYREGFGVFPK